MGAALLGDIVGWFLVPGIQHYMGRSKHVMLCTFGNTFVYSCVHMRLFPAGTSEHLPLISFK